MSVGLMCFAVVAHANGLLYPAGVLSGLGLGLSFTWVDKEGREA